MTTEPEPTGPTGPTGETGPTGPTVENTKDTSVPDIGQSTFSLQMSLATHIVYHV
jgi:hypothetical protein